jgi:hypothetical protein
VARDLFGRMQLYGEDAKPLKAQARTGFDVEVLYLAVKAGYRIDEIPVRWRYQAASRANVLVDPIHMLSDVLKVRRMANHGVYDAPHPHDRAP